MSQILHFADQDFVLDASGALYWPLTKFGDSKRCTFG